MEGKSAFPLSPGLTRRSEAGPVECRPGQSDEEEEEKKQWLGEVRFTRNRKREAQRRSFV